MKVSELIKELKKVIVEFGDLPVYVEHSDGYFSSPVKNISVMDSFKIDPKLILGRKNEIVPKRIELW